MQIIFLFRKSETHVQEYLGLLLISDLTTLRRALFERNPFSVAFVSVPNSKSTLKLSYARFLMAKHSVVDPVMLHSNNYTDFSAFQHNLALPFRVHPFCLLVYLFKVRSEQCSSGVLTLILEKYKL